MIPHHSLVDEPSTWIRFRAKLCHDCTAGCCSLPVEVTANDLIRMRFMTEFELQENPKTVARRLMKQGIIEHFSMKKQLFTISRLANGDCIFLDRTSRRCTIYFERPDTCRNHPRIGPRSGYCAYSSKQGMRGGSR